MTQDYDPNFPEQLDYLIKNCGFPTFDEFRKNPDKYRLRPDQFFESVNGSNLSMKDSIKKESYYWRDEYACDSLEQVERIARDEGFSGNDLEMEPVLKPLHGSSCDGEAEMIIRFWPKAEFAARGGVVASVS